MERVNLSNANIQNSPNQHHSQSFSSPGLPTSSDGRSILLVAEDRKLGSNVDFPLFLTSLSGRALIYPQPDYSSLSWPLLSHRTACSCSACSLQPHGAPPQSISARQPEQPFKIQHIRTLICKSPQGISITFSNGD